MLTVYRNWATKGPRGNKFMEFARRFGSGGVERRKQNRSRSRAYFLNGALFWPVLVLYSHHGGISQDRRPCQPSSSSYFFTL